MHMSLSPYIRIITTRLILLSVALFMVAIPTDARRKKSTAQKLKLMTENSVSQTVCHPYDTLKGSESMVRFFGYEKGLRSTKESVFVQNRLADRRIEAVWFTISYYDTLGNLLHKRSVKQRAMIPPSSTRRIDFKSWDTQRSFYYYSTPPTRTTATPYKVSIDADTLLLAPYTRPQ